jgi:SET domain-containing protein
MGNKKIIIKKTKNMGKGLFAIKPIKKGELISDWTKGKVYIAEKAGKLPKKIRNHAIQFDEHKWIDTEDIGRYINHSCEPNCGLKGKFKIVSIRNIKKGEQLTYDYEMTEDSNWKMKCKCKTKSCRKIIGTYKNLPEEIKDKYKSYTSKWLLKKYNK